MIEIERVLVTYGVELCSNFYKHDAATEKSEQEQDRQYHDEKRRESAIRMDELCLLASLLGVGSYDDFREQIQKAYEISKEETV